MTAEELEILASATEIIGSLKDQLRGTGTDLDRDIAARLIPIEVDLHAVIARAEASL